MTKIKFVSNKEKNEVSFDDIPTGAFFSHGAINSVFIKITGYDAYKIETHHIMKLRDDAKCIHLTDVSIVY